MLSWIRYRSQLRTKEKLRRKSAREWQAVIAEKKRAGSSGDAIRFHEHSASVELEWLDDEIGDMQTEYLRSVAPRWFVQIPARPHERDAEGNLIENSAWYVSSLYGEPILTKDARSAIMKQIIVAKRERRLEWVQWLAAITGVLGALIGVAAIVLE